MSSAQGRQRSKTTPPLTLPPTSRWPTWQSTPPWLHRKLRSSSRGLKTDPFQVGTTIYLARSSRDLCLVAELLSYIAVRGNRPGPLFCLPKRDPLSQQVLVKEIRLTLESIGVNASRYSRHSFHIGATTSGFSTLYSSMPCKRFSISHLVPMLNFSKTATMTSTYM